MLEIALLLIASAIALVTAVIASRRAGFVAGPAETVRSARHLRDDAVVAAGASVVMFALTAIGHGHAGAMVAAAWAGGACAMGALAAMAARAWRQRALSHAAGAVAEQVVIVLALGVLTAIAASAAHAISDPQRLASQVPEMIASFAVGCAALDMGERALPSIAAMVLASYFFDSNAGTLRSGPSYASALGVVLFPLALAALAAVGAAVSSVVWVDESATGSAKRAQAASVLALPAAIGAALALAGWLWAPLAICGALGASMTLVPRLVDRSTGDKTPGRAAEAASLVSLAAVAIGSYAIARHTGLAHAGPFGIAVAAAAAEAAALVERSESEDSLADRQAAALAAIAITLAVLDGATLFRCTRFADLSHAPTEDTAALLAHCTIANIAPARIDMSHPVTIAAALAGLAASVVLRPDAIPTLRSRAITLGCVALGVVALAAIAHFGFGLGIEAAASATLAASFATALFPGAASRNVAAIIAASALALGAVIG